MNPLLKFCSQIEWKVWVLSLGLEELLSAPFLDTAKLALPEMTYLGSFGSAVEQNISFKIALIAPSGRSCI